MVSTKFTIAAYQVLRDIAAEPQCGADLSRSHRIQSGSMYRMLHRFEDQGLVRSKHENGDPEKLKRPLKRIYRITAAGRKKLRELAG